MYAAHQERPPPLQPPLSMDRQAPIEHNGQTYSTPSSTTQTSLPKLPQSPDEPRSVSCEDNNRVYSLEVVQQPVRARMCGFGDKVGCTCTSCSCNMKLKIHGKPQDRRPITPPPCIKLIVRDAQTGKDIDISEIDTSFFVLTVDLWSENASKEVNLVRHSATSPSISAATSASYPPRPPTPPYGTANSAPNSAHPNWQQQPQIPQQPIPQQHPSTHQYAYPQPAQIYQNYRGPLPPQRHPQYHPSQQQYPPPPYAQQQSYLPQQQPQGYYATTPSTPMGYYPPHPAQNQGPLVGQDQSAPQSGTAQPSGMFTRNLIGSLCVSAFKLTSPDAELGIWFILQDLSVRTEGTFRLKMNFVNVGSQSSSTALNTTAAPVLASIFSGVFQVFSAKKFPGVIESTPLSKCFATQGIKIPIRKDGPRGNVRDRDEFEEDNE